MEKSIFEAIGGSYTMAGDTRLPDLIMGESVPLDIGKYGRMRRRYLKEHRPVLYTNLLTTGKLDQHLAEIDKECKEQMEWRIKQMAKQEGVTESLKAADQMEWVRRMNSIRGRAEELVFQKLVFTD